MAEVLWVRAKADKKDTEKKKLRTRQDVQRLICKPPMEYKSGYGALPFHIPNWKLLEKFEVKLELAEPLTGFRDRQLNLLKYRQDFKKTGIAMRTEKLAKQRESKYIVKLADTDILPHFKLSNVANQRDLIEKLRNGEIKGFVYLVYAVPRSSEHYTPYALTLVPYKQVDKRYFLTMSIHGVTQYIGPEQIFTTLSKWEDEYNMYTRLMRIKSFFYFRLWKGFFVWRKAIIYHKMKTAREFLRANLFVLNPLLRQALLDIQAMKQKLISTTFTNVEVIEFFELFYFIEAQMDKLESMVDTLKDFRDVAKDIISNACHGALLAQGFIPDESLLETEKEKAPTGRGREKRLKTSYIEQANKKKYCIRLTSFIILADYIILDLLHQLMLNSTQELLTCLETHYAFIPQQSVLEGTALDHPLEEPRPDNAPNRPLIIVDVIIEPTLLRLDPNMDVTIFAFEQLMQLWEYYVIGINSFIRDRFYSNFTNPIINGKLEDRICGYGPPLEFYLNNDHYLRSRQKSCIQILESNFNDADVFLRRLVEIRDFFTEDSDTLPVVIEQERALEKFRNLCRRYHTELEIIDSVCELQPLGILYLHLENFIMDALPEPTRLIGIIEKVIPQIGRDKVATLIQGVEVAQAYLDKEPTSASEYVEYINYIDQSCSIVDDMEIELDYCKELYDIMEEFEISIASDDMNNYLGISVSMGTLRNVVDKKTDEKVKFIKKFNDQMSKDISALIGDVGEVKDACLKPWLYDINSNPEEVTTFLNGLYEQLMECQQRANEFKNYQKQFKLEVTRFDILEEVNNDVKLRILLWESLDQWDKTIKEWYSADFYTLNVEDMNLFTAKNVKNITQLEKGLPKNLIVPKLREYVESMKDKLPVITFLRNTSLKQRHWMKIENILNHKFKMDETLTLELLESLKVFNHPQELMEISGQASSEAGLEALLRKVDDSWKALELPIIPHKDTKDVYIMGSTEDVQAILDESCINITTIASSRHVGPIKPRVDEWQRQLDLFSRTLDEWQTCQQSWLYLEVIFSAPDIQRQLPSEAKMFLIVDKSWKEIMRRTAKVPLAMEAATYPGLIDALIKNNNLLEQIMKCLESYLETKRVAFPRFFFLSNDELLDILAQTRNPHAVQLHLRKCFDAIAKLEFGTKESAVQVVEGQEPTEKLAAPILTTDIIAMISPEGERVALGKGLKARGNVEDWLGKVEESMFMSLRRCMKASIQDYNSRDREEWVLNHAYQVILTVSQIMWAGDVHAILDRGYDKQLEMEIFGRHCVSDLNKLAAVVRGDLSKVTRLTLIALITIDVHARDTVINIIKKQIYDSNNFEWLKMLRYYWQDDIDNCMTKMSSANYLYGYEYLGASGVLVITPLTDRCYLCLMGALQLDLGGAPAGPAGTGKTETTKDLGKALAIQCVVFNCSEGLDFKMMGRFFSGLATSGAWCCFDEFNRIDIEVLSVIAQQLITIRNAKAAKLTRFMFEGREIKLVHQCSAFITMNPGYAGRTELPDNLKALFRPIAMMVPDYALIAEVILYSEGFVSSKVLSNKMVQMYKLCSEQLSQQDHYDFGMRAVKSVLVMAGSLKRASPNRDEDVVLICALRDSNLPKFLKDDALLFQGILNDLFPGIDLPIEDYGLLQQAIVDVMVNNNLQPLPNLIHKVIQLYETMNVRWGVMLVGPTGGGKSEILKTLNRALSKMHDDGIEGPNYQPVHTYIMNPKAVTAGELYGEINPFTLEWRDGLMGIMVRTAVTATNEDHQWVICDGPVDAVWVENLNTVLDDNKMLCLANSERIKLTPYVHMLFEVMDLAQASPATVSRCGMVYIDSDELKWFPFVQSWVNSLSEELVLGEIKELLYQLFEEYVQKGFNFLKKHCDFSMHQVDISKVQMVCSLIDSHINMPGAMKAGEKARVRSFVCQIFIFSYTWGLGGNLFEYSREKFETYIRDQFDDHPEARLPVGNDLLSLYINTNTHKMETWNEIIPQFVYNNTLPFFETLVPTIDTVRFGYIMERLLNVDHPVFFTGGTGVGKSVIARGVLNKMFGTGLFVPITLNFSAQTSSARTQEILESKLEKRKKTLLGAPIGKKIILFVDDVNMPKLETYGAQPPIELLRQFIDYGGLYDREKLYWKDIKDVCIAAACAPPGGGRNPLTPRFIRHFGMCLIPSPNEYALKSIFKAIMKGFLTDFIQQVSDLGDYMVNAAVEIYNRIAEDLLPTPAKSHYVFNLRDLSKCIQGVLQADVGTMRDEKTMLRLFYHESLRTFHDRLINIEDKSYFYRLMRDICIRQFGSQVLELPDENIIETPPMLIFGDFMKIGAAKEDRIYEEIKDIGKLKGVLQDYLVDYNLLMSKDASLIFFLDAIEHCSRIARILRAERGNGLLVGVGGMGKQSLTRLASHLNGYRTTQIELTRNYDHSAFFEDLRKMYFNAGANKQNTVFLFTDTQIVQEEFLEDINNILNSGEVPNLFETDELEKCIIACRSDAKIAGIAENNRDGIFDFFIRRVRSNLHLVLCMSPVGDAFRRRCRMFPSLVNCCSIDWFMKWPTEALFSVAKRSLKPIMAKDLAVKLANCTVMFHESVEVMTNRFYEEMRRYYYTTPSSYLELLKLYMAMLHTRKTQIIMTRDRIANGLNKLYDTNAVIDTMKEALVAMEPELAKKKVAVGELMISLNKEQKQADRVRNIVKQDEEISKEKAADTQALAADAQADLDTALPAMEAATKALEALNKNDINEIRVFQKPPILVQFVMESVCLLLGAKTDWATAKLVMGDGYFLKRLQDYDKNHIPEKTLFKLKEYVNHKDFIPEKIVKVSKVCKSMCIWVRAIDIYAKVYKVVEPKRKKLEQAEKELATVMLVLREKQRQLIEVEAHIEALEQMFNASLAEMQQLEADIELTATRLHRAGRLNVALGDEQIRWEQTVVACDHDLYCLVGDVLLAAAYVAYLGAFTSNYRRELVDSWRVKCKELEIPASNNFSLVTVLADPYDIRMWNTWGLPRDSVSTENAIIVTKAGRWPLMIDPQEQANRWIRQMEADNQMKIIKLTDANFMRVLETAIRIGIPVLLEELGETLDPTLGPVLMKQTFIQGGRTLIRLGDSDIDYDSNFRFYLTTKLSNPHYLPEICIQVTIVNFTVTPTGLEEQLLADVVRLERPDLETARNELIIRINADKTQLKNIEVKILRLLFHSTGNILDDEELIETLNESKETSGIIAARLIETEATEVKISIAREKYRSVATRGSVLYFVVSQLAEIDPMYQYSLKYFKQIFNTVIETSTKNENLHIRLNILYDEITLAVYTNISRGLFERHKLVYSFMLCVAIYMEKGDVTDAQWNYLLRGPIGSGGMDLAEKPNFGALTDSTWLAVNYLAMIYEEEFGELPDECCKTMRITIGSFNHEICALPYSNRKSEVDWNSKLSDFMKLMLVRTIQEENLVFAITEYVKKNLGQTFIESPQVSLQLLYQNTSNVIPLIFVLSTGSDPFGAFQRFANDMGYKERIQCISLGQGQGPVAEKLIQKGKSKGDWIFLQNCHLASSWMLQMERIILAIAEEPNKIHTDFRIFLSSMPNKIFPVAVLQNSVKVTNEPPRGLRANIKRAFIDMTEEFFKHDLLGQSWRTMLFGICMFHAIVQERKKFGPLGWNIVYEFNDSDREFAFNTLKMYCDIGYVPWDALEYITGEITYGGRVTDMWDLRCLKVILKSFFSPQTLESEYKYSVSGVYYCPTFKELHEYREFIDTLPILEEPEIFGMHENANIAFQIKETHNVIVTIMDSQPRASGGSEGKSTDAIVLELSENIVEVIIIKIQNDDPYAKLLILDDKGRLASLSTVLLQEIDRFNKLLKLIHSSMQNLQKAIKGFVVMSEQLEEVFKALINNQIPKMWSSKSYPSLKTLGSWVHDLELRIDFISVWLKSGPPPSYWLSGFYFPQGFLTGTLQTHARKYNTPIDQLKYDFLVMKTYVEQEDVRKEHVDASGKEVPSAYGEINVPEDGVIIHGLFMDAGRWSLKRNLLVDPKPGVINPALPSVLLTPVIDLTQRGRYACPLYKTSVRAGVLSTTGHSTNFVLAVFLPSNEHENYWILKGTALLTQLTN